MEFNGYDATVTSQANFLVTTSSTVLGRRKAVRVIRLEKFEHKNLMIELKRIMLNLIT
jgi:hypothetical protein